MKKLVDEIRKLEEIFGAESFEVKEIEKMHKFLNDQVK